MDGIEDVQQLAAQSGQAFKDDSSLEAAEHVRSVFPETWLWASTQAGYKISAYRSHIWLPKCVSVLKACADELA